MKCCQRVYMNIITSKRCPKYLFVGRTTLSMGVVSSAVIDLNNEGYNKLRRNMG